MQKIERELIEKAERLNDEKEKVCKRLTGDWNKMQKEKE